MALKNFLQAGITIASVFISLPFTHNINTMANSNIKTHSMVGWVEQSQDNWYLYDSHGVLVTGWYDKYHFNTSIENLGLMDYGWYTEAEKTYFFSTKQDERFGQYITGWNWIDGYCYLFDNNGALVANLPEDTEGNSTNAEGKWLKNGVLQHQPGQGYTLIPKSVQGYTPNMNDTSFGGNTNVSASKATFPDIHSAEISTNVSKNVLMIQPKSGVSSNYVNNLIKPYGGKIIHTLHSIGVYIVDFSSINTKEQLEQVKSTLQNDTGILGIYYDAVYSQ